MAEDLLKDHATTIDDLKKMANQFCNERNWAKFHTPKDLAIGLITEASEFLEHFRFRSDTEIEELLKTDFKFRNQLEDELADTIYFILRISDKFQIDLTHSLIEKLKKTALKYPIEKSFGSNKKYTEL